MRRGRKLLGHFYRFDDGRVCFLANRKHKHIYRRGKAWISHALKEDVAYWPIEATLLLRCRREGVRIVGVRCSETGAIWLTALANYFNYEVATGGCRFNGEEARAVPLSYFTRKDGRIKL